MSIRSAMISISLSAALVTGCASLIPPERPAYSGQDTVTVAESDQLLGTWLVVDLNPYPNTDNQPITLSYLGDGTLLGRADADIDKTKLADMGVTDINFTGQWSVQGDVLSHNDVRMNVVGGNSLVAMMAERLNQSRMMAGQANIYELTPDRIVIVSSDGAAMEYTRQQ